jgi:hypothetical protein
MVQNPGLPVEPNGGKCHSAWLRVTPMKEWKGNNVLRHQQVRASGRFAQYLFSALAGCDDNEDLICLMRRAVNNPNVWFCERRALSQQRVAL